MENITIGEIISVTNGTLLSGNTDQIINSVSCDSRKIGKNTLFVPLKGENFDGNDFIEAAFNNGAVVSFVGSYYDSGKITGPLIEVEDTLRAMQDLAKYYRSKFDIPIIGVTGSVGKTTTKEMIASALGTTMKVFKTEGNHNGQIGLPLTIFDLDKSYEVAVFEMGVSQVGEMERLAEIANPDIGVITNIGMSHLENFRTTEATCREKLKIVQKSKGILYLNGDSPILAKEGAKLTNEVVFFGINGDYAYRCQDVYANKECTNFTLVTQEFRDEISIPCLGIHNVYNALAAIAIAMKMGIHLEDIKSGLSTFRNIAMRQQISTFNGVTIIDDSYNASPDSMKSAISVLKLVEGGRKIVVMGDMLELGENSADAHRDIGRYISIEGIDVLVTVGEMSECAADGALTANQNIMVHKCNNTDEAFNVLKNLVAKDDKVLVKGSRGTHMEKIVQKLQEYLRKI